MIRKMGWSFLLLGMASLSQATFTEINSKLDEIDTQVSTVSAETSSLSVHLAKTLSDLKSRTHMDKGPLLVGSVVTAIPGNTVDFSITLIPTIYDVSGLQVDVSVPTGLSIVSVTAGPASLAAGKSLTYSNGRILVFGLNQTSIGYGAVATLKVQVNVSAATNFYPINLINPTVTDPNGNALLSSAESGTVEVAQ